MTLEHFDTVLSFVVIIAGVSLLVTVLTQIVSALFGLRGTNLRWGIQTLLETADPNLAKTDAKEKKSFAEMISQEVLQHSLISDSTLSDVEKGIPDRWTLATAISKDQLIDILHRLSDETPTPAEGTAAPPWAVPLKNALDTLDAGEADKLLQLAPKINELFPDNPARADEIISNLTGAAEQLSGHINQWFDSVMDRVSQRFVTHMRIWTIIFSIVIAFAAHLDTFQLLTQLSTDSELRARLVNSADALSQEAERAQLLSTNEIPGTETAAREQLTNAANNIQVILNDKLKFQLVPNPYPQPFYNYWTPNWSHFWGIAACAALLSLGAPFWFNMLKTLSSLRPVLANKAEDAAENEK